MTDTKGYGLISADSHVVEPSDLFDRVPAGLRDKAPKLAPWQDGSAWMIDGADPVPLQASYGTAAAQKVKAGAPPRTAVNFDEVVPGLHDPAERLALQDLNSLDAEVLYPNARLWDAIRTLDDDVQLACVRAYNDWIAEYSKHSPSRLIGLGKIPATGIEAAEEELGRCVKDLELRGAVLDAWPSATAVPGDASEDGFWNIVNESGIPLSIHYAIGKDATTAAPSGIVSGNIPPLMSAAALPLQSALFERFPEVRLVLAHANAGWAFYWLEMQDATYLRRRHLPDFRLPFNDPDSLPSQHLRAHYWFTFHQDRTAVKNRHLIGPAHLMWASEYPFDTTNWPDDRQQAVRVTDEVPEDDRRSLLSENTSRLYRLPGFEDGFTKAAIETFDDLVHV